MTSIHKIIAAISPDTYCDASVRKKVKKLVKTKGYLEAAQVAKPVSGDLAFSYDSAYKDPLGNYGIKNPIEKHSIVYDSAAEGLEPIYYWVYDYFRDSSGSVEKLSDNFITSPGSSYHQDIVGRFTQAQQEVGRILGNVNTVIKSILNIIYDLKDFKLRLKNYDDLHSKDPKEKSAAILSLKQIWMDKVDLFNKGTGSLRQLSQQYEYVTLIDSFMVTNSLKKVDELDLNDRVKRILKQRVQEFQQWLDISEKELRKRFEIEKRYLKTQVSTVQLYSRWLKPYLRAAKELEQRADPQAALVSTFSTLILELDLMALDGYDPIGDVKAGNLPLTFGKVKARKYSPLCIAELRFRGIPQRVGQGWAYGGRVDMTFTSYALNEEELKVLREVKEKDELDDVLELIHGTTDDSLGHIQSDIDEFLEEKNEKKAGIGPDDDEDVNPFKALFSFLKIEKKEKKKFKTTDPIKPDSFYEKTIRSQAIIAAREKCFTTHDTYKKLHGMLSHSDPFKAIPT